MISFLTAVVASGLSFTCTPTAVYDGDGPIWCAEGPKIRLAGIAAREMDGTCRSNQPCPKTGAAEARSHLASLVGRPIGRRPEGHILVKADPLRCVSEGNGRGSRTAAWCKTAHGVDLSCAMVRSGMALRWARYQGDKVCHGRGKER
jgi:endonuclease YncB( thermonuclease family)